jgi:hypothetical protein
MHHGSEGSSHDPYSFTEYLFIENDMTVKLHAGLCVWITVNGVSLGVPEEKVGSAFLSYTGLSPDQFVKIHDKLHPWFDDPMGHPSQYI